MDRYKDDKRTANLLGIVMLVGGLILVAYGFLSYMQYISRMISGSFNFTSLDNIFNTIFFSMGLIGGGGILVTIGVYLVFMGNIKKLTKYVAHETAPATTETSRSIARGFNQGRGYLKKRKIINQKVKIRCRTCGALNEEYAHTCLACGHPL